MLSRKSCHRDSDAVPVSPVSKSWDPSRHGICSLSHGKKDAFVGRKGEEGRGGNNCLTCFTQYS